MLGKQQQSEAFKGGRYDVSLFDLGGGERIRDIWKHYFAESHGVIFVVDSSDVQRMTETKDTLANVLKHPRIMGKPVLLLANKQDRDGALREADVIYRLSLENLMHQNNCRCKIAIQSGLKWLLKTVAMDYESTSERVQNDTAEQKEQEEKERRERSERVRQAREERERREREEAEREGKTSEPEKEESIMANPFQPIGDIISEMVLKKTESTKDSAEKTAQAPADHSPKRKGKLCFWKKNKVGPLTPDGPAKTRRGPKTWFGWFRCNVVTPQ
ncbi:hypothetical protein SKAU_G00130530 [Synaphobranchus kaupii]|uniref:ADP-ribosylation factor-like protein 13B n=2 Tax=Synaphobranchus kaupii TaxID=118154 RepID=A0A9Q1FQF2_SYNKA|nr:hypothetical protein SKAU_G00130530 [Synaphobranchus kaupii]